MLSYATPATIKANNNEADRILARQKGTGVDRNSPLSPVQAKDFAAALERHKRG